jgi:hypothetical protein
MPCYDCEERRPGCHAACKKYQEALEAYGKTRDAEKQETDARSLLHDYEQDNIRRARNR